MTAATNLQASIAEVQSVEVDNQVDVFANGNERTLEHLSLDSKLTDSVAKGITSEFGFLVSYSASLKDATTPGTSWTTSVSSLNSAASKAATDASSLTGAIGEKNLLTAADVQTFNTDAGNVANAVSSVGQGLLTIYGEEKAYKIANAADKAVQKYCADLEDLLTKDSDSDLAAPKTGLAGILYADYEVKKSVLKNLATTAFPPGEYENPNHLQFFLARRDLVHNYSTLLTNEKSGVAKIISLRKAVADIASAHAALANKDDKGFKEEIADAADLLKSAFTSSQSGSANTQK
jgi:hypothetical protein